MTEEKTLQKSELIVVLREGVSVVQMVLFKELRILFAEQYQNKDITQRSMLAGAIINKLFGMENPEEKFQEFNTKNHGVIEQELLSLAEQLPQLQTIITDALRVQTLCDTQEGEDATHVLQQAEELGILIKDRELPLPSTFMTLIRMLGEKHSLTITPSQITPEDDTSLVH
jgi:hypothetical protein